MVTKREYTNLVGDNKTTLLAA